MKPLTQDDLNKERPSSVNILAKIICEAEGDEPLLDMVGVGGIVELGVKYKLWQAHLPQAEAIFNRLKDDIGFTNTLFNEAEHAYQISMQPKVTIKNQSLM